MVKDTENFFEANEIFYNIAGLWLYNFKHASKRRRYLQIVWTSTEYTMGVAFLILEFIIMRETVKDVNKFFCHIGIVLSHCLGIFKGALLVIRHKRIRKIIDTLQDKNYQYESLDKFKPAHIFMDGKKFSQICTTLIFLLYTLVGVFSHISSVSRIHKEIEGTHFEGNYTCGDFMPYYFFIPVQVNTRAQCDYILIFVDFSLCVYAWLIGCYDGFFVALLNCLKTQLIILRGALKSIRKRVLLKLDMKQNLQIFQDDSLPFLEEELYRELKHLTKHLTILLSVAKELEEIFSFMILAQTLTSLFNVASCLFNVSKVPLGSPEFFATMQYFICMLLQLALVCWFGSGITRASEEILAALYDTDWLSASRRFKTSLIITMSRMQRPIYLTIGKFFPLTLSATISVCKASYSYYTVFSRD